MAHWRSLGLDFVTLRVFKAAVEEKSFVNAAEREHLAASAISRRIAELEGRLGIALLRRHDRGVEPTPAGHALMKHVESLFEIVEVMLNDLEALTLGETGEVRLLANLSTISSVLPPVLGRILREHADIDLHLEQRNSEDALIAVQRGTADIAFVTGVEIPPDVTAFEFMRDRLSLVLPASHPLCERPGSLGMPDLRGVNYIALRNDLALQDLIRRKATGEGFELAVSVIADGFDSLAKFVAAGMGITIIPNCHAREAQGKYDLEVLPLDEDWAERGTFVCVKSVAALGPAARLVLEKILDAAQTDPGGIPIAPAKTAGDDK